MKKGAYDQAILDWTTESEEPSLLEAEYVTWHGDAQCCDLAIGAYADDLAKTTIASSFSALEDCNVDNSQQLARHLKKREVRLHPSKGW